MAGKRKIGRTQTSRPNPTSKPTCRASHSTQVTPDFRVRRNHNPRARSRGGRPDGLRGGPEPGPELTGGPGRPLGGQHRRQRPQHAG
jgi:hypothetical protein